MKVLALNASPNEDNGNTYLILKPFLDGMKASGADIELIYLNRLNILPCKECTDDLTFESNGECNCDDDMNMLYPKFREADIWIFATPNYYDGLVPKMKHLLDRLEPLFSLGDDFTANNGFTGKLAFVSTCDLYDLNNFDIITSHFKALSELFAKEFAGALLRPHINALLALRETGNSVEDVFEAANDAGKQIIVNGKISTRTLESVSRRLVPKKSFIAELGNYKDKNFSFA
jgi:hypothetical protein